MFCPKQSHEKALKRIGRYLKATQERGLILNPNPVNDGTGGDALQIDSYPDADFAGLYGYEKTTDPASVKSRTGFIITVAESPVLWQSKLQTETALSTMEAEIVALAHSCRELFPVMDIVSSLGPAVGIPAGETTMKVTIMRTTQEHWFLPRLCLPNLHPEASIMLSRQCGSGSKLSLVESSWSRLTLWNSWAICLPRALGRFLLNIFGRRLWDGRRGRSH